MRDVAFYSEILAVNGETGFTWLVYQWGCKLIAKKSGG